MMFELAVLHVFHKGKVEFGHIVLVHVEEDVTDHHDAFFDLFPDAIKFRQELFIRSGVNLFCNRLQQIDRSVTNTVIEHLSMLVEHETIGSPIELFI